MSRTIAVVLVSVATGTVVTAPSVLLPVLLWITCVFTMTLYLGHVRKLEQIDPSRKFLGIEVKHLISERWVASYSLVGIILSAGLIWVVMHSAEYRANMVSESLWAFLLLPLIYYSRHGEKQGMLHLISISEIIVIVFPILTYGLSLPVVSSSLISGALLGSLALGSHVTIRTLREQDLRAACLNEVITFISNRSQLKIDYDEIAKEISTKLSYPIVTILLWDSTESTLFPSGAYGYDGEARRRIRVQRGKGMVGRVFELGTSEFCGSVREPCRLGIDTVSAPGHQNIRSELAVPLLYESERLGVLHLESHVVEDFDKEDIDEAQLLAHALASAIKWKQTAETQLLLWQTINHHKPFSSTDKLIETVLDSVMLRLRPSIVTFYQTIPETGIPRKHLPDYRGTVDKKSLESDLDHQVLWRTYPHGLIAEWQFHLVRDTSKKDQAFFIDGKLSDFITREQIRSAVFMPLGRKDCRLGVLLLYYRHSPAFTNIVISQLRAFEAAFTLAMLRLHELDRTSDSLKVDLHRNLSNHLYHINAHIRELRSSTTSPDLSALHKMVHALEDRITQMHGTVLRDASRIFDKNPPDLNDAVQNALRPLVASRNIQLNVNIERGLNNLTPALRGILYAIIVEAATNALAYANPTQIRVTFCMKTERGTVEGSITDDGSGIDVEKSQGSETGIFALRDWVRTKLNGNIEITKGEEVGTRVEVRIPVLLEEGKNHEHKEG